MKHPYYILTVQRDGNYSSKTMFHEGSLVAFVLIEQELELISGKKQRSIINSIEITKEEYDYAISLENKRK